MYLTKINFGKMYRLCLVVGKYREKKMLRKIIFSYFILL